MKPTLRDGWLCVAYDGHDAALVRIGITDRTTSETTWAPAFLDYVGGVRVAKIRPPADVPARNTVQLEVAGSVTSLGAYPA